MPNYYAHLTFGRAVYRRLPPVLKGQLTGQMVAFELGTYGPDPLYFYRVVRGDLRRIGLDVHHSSFRPLALRLLEAVRQDLPGARGYAAGYITHYALDSRCHYYIEEQMARRGLSHTGMEQELDRALMRAQGIDPLHETPMPPPPRTLQYYETAAAVHPGVTARMFCRGTLGYRNTSRFQTHAAGTPIPEWINRAGNRFQKLSVVRGTILTAHPGPDYADTTAELIRLTRAEVVPTADAVVRFFTAAYRGTALDDWFDRPFIGQWALDQASGVPAADRNPS